MNRTLGKVGIEASALGSGCSGVSNPIPRFKTRTRVRENAGPIGFGPLPPAEAAETDAILGRPADQAAAD